MNPDFRLYTFCNFYLSSIQQGIQSAHVTHSLFVKYPTENSSGILWDWAKNFKTMIVLNGGAAPDIASAFEAIQHLKVEYEGEVLPVECFYEDASLNEMMTCFGVVVPKCFYDAKPAKWCKWTEDIGGDIDAFVFDEQVETSDGMVEKRTVYHKDTAEHFFIGIVKACGLAR